MLWRQDSAGSLHGEGEEASQTPGTSTHNIQSSQRTGHKLCKAAVTAAFIFLDQKVKNLFTIMLYVRQKLIYISEFLNNAVVPCKNVYLSPPLEKLL